MRNPVLGLVMIMVLAACSPGASQAPSAAPPSAPPSAAAPSDAPSQAAGPISVEHSMGTAELPAPATKVVALEWDLATATMGLGVDPVGVAGADIYGDWVGSSDLPATVTDVGTRQEPNLETIAQLEPDLILAVKFRHEAIYEQLNAIAPTIVFDPYPDDPAFDAWAAVGENTRTIGKALGLDAKAEEVLAALDAKLADATARVAAANLATTDYVLSQAATDQGNASLRLYLDNSTAVQTLNRMGLTNAWKGSGAFEIYGFSTVGIEALPAVQGANFIYEAQAADNPITGMLADNPVWNGLDFVKEERVYALAPDAWFSDAPTDIEYLIDSVLQALGA